MRTQLSKNPLSILGADDASPRASQLYAAELIRDKARAQLRRTLSSMHHVEAMEQLTKQLAKFKSNREFISLIASSRADD
jgi:transcription termination factor Rho